MILIQLYRQRMRADVVRKSGAVFLMAALALQLGCYSYRPVEPSPPPVSSRVAVALNDQGRVLLGDKLGAGIERVEGVLLSSDSTGVLLAVSKVRELNGGSTIWSGEEVFIPREATFGYRSRVLSKSRSLLLAGIVVGAIAYITFGMSLDLFGEDGPDKDTVDPPEVPGGQTFRGGIVPLP